MYESYISECFQISDLNVLVEMRVTALRIIYGTLKEKNALVSILDIYKNHISLRN